MRKKKDLIRAADAKEVGVGNPAEETYHHPNQNLWKKYDFGGKCQPLSLCCLRNVLVGMYGRSGDWVGGSAGVGKAVGSGA
jgi:hypothetical protein